MAITWDFFNSKVQKGLPHGQFLSGRSTVIGAGPPNILSFAQGTSALEGDELVYLIGLNQNLSIAHTANVQRFFEIGSVRQYFITGHNITTIQMNRILYHGPNLLRAFYAYYSSTSDKFVMGPLLKRYKNMPFGVNKHTVEIPAGEQNWFINMASDLFSQPIGLLIMLRDQDELTYGLAYAENCYVDTYGMSTDSTSILMTENTNIQCERILPIGSGVVDLVQTLDESIIKVTEDGGDIVATSSGTGVTSS